MTTPTDATETVEAQLRSFITRCIESDQLAAEGAGHGFGQQPLGTPRNAGWTDLDERENSRPSRDEHLVRLYSPDRVLAECASKRDIIRAVAGTEDEQIVLRAMAEAYRDRPGFGTWDRHITRESRPGSLVVACTVCGDQVSIPTKSEARVTPAAWETDHQHRDGVQ